ncbi:unnamed protein product, partial [Iphiclides podalirius]
MHVGVSKHSNLRCDVTMKPGHKLSRPLQVTSGERFSLLAPGARELFRGRPTFERRSDNAARVDVRAPQQVRRDCGPAGGAERAFHFRMHHFPHSRDAFQIRIAS